MKERSDQGTRVFIDLQSFYTDTMLQLNDDSTVRHVTCVKNKKHGPHGP
jgi:hypothetical protein